MVVYADFLSYDEVGQHSGVERYDALAVLAPRRSLRLRSGHVDTRLSGLILVSKG